MSNIFVNKNIMKKVYTIIMAEEKPYDFIDTNGQNIKGCNVALSLLCETTNDNGQISHKSENIKINKDIFQKWLFDNQLNYDTCINSKIELYAYASEKVKANYIKSI